MWTPNGLVCDYCKAPIPLGTGVMPAYFFIHHRYCDDACLEAAEEERRRAWRAKDVSVKKYGRFWKLVDGNGELVCITVYKKGAAEVVNRLKKAA